MDQCTKTQIHHDKRCVVRLCYNDAGTPVRPRAHRVIFDLRHDSQRKRHQPPEAVLLGAFLGTRPIQTSELLAGLMSES